MIMYFGYETFDDFYDFINPLYKGKRVANSFNVNKARNALGKILSYREGTLDKIHDLKKEISEIHKTTPPKPRSNDFTITQELVIDYHLKLLQKAGPRNYFDAMHIRHQTRLAKIEDLQNIIDADRPECFKTYLYKRDIERRQAQRKAQETE